MRLWLLWILICQCGWLSAQFLPVRRAGSEDVPSEAAAHLQGTEAPILGYFPAEVTDRRRDFLLTFFDRDLQEKSSLRIPLPEHYQLIHSFYADGSAWFLFWYEGLNGQYLILEARDETFRMFDWNEPDLNFQAALLKDEKLMIAGSGNDDLVMVAVDLQDQQRSEWRVPLALRSEVYEIRPDGRGGGFEAMVKEKDRPAKWIRWGGDGFVEEVWEVELEEGKWPLAVQQEGDLVLGTYAEEEDGSAQGVFVAREVKGVTEALHTVDFMDIPGFWESVEEEETKGWGGNRKKREKNGLQGEYRVHWKRMAAEAGHVLVVAEVGLATYRLETYQEPDEFDRPVLKYRKVFDGWLVTHGIFLELDPGLKVLNQAVFEFDDVRTYADIFRCHFTPDRVYFPFQGELQFLERQGTRLRPGPPRPIFEDERQTEGWAVALFPLADQLLVWGHRDIYRDRFFSDNQLTKNFFFQPMTAP